MGNVQKKWNRYAPCGETLHTPPRTQLRILRRKGKQGERYYVEMRWGPKRKFSKLLGLFPTNSPTPLMDVALYASYTPGRLELDELYQLLQADKSLSLV